MRPNNRRDWRSSGSRHHRPQQPAFEEYSPSQPRLSPIPAPRDPYENYGTHAHGGDQGWTGPSSRFERNHERQWETYAEGSHQRSWRDAPSPRQQRPSAAAYEMPWGHGEYDDPKAWAPSGNEGSKSYDRDRENWIAYNEQRRGPNSRSWPSAGRTRHNGSYGANAEESGSQGRKRKRPAELGSQPDIYKLRNDLKADREERARWRKNDGATERNSRDVDAPKKSAYSKSSKRVSRSRSRSYTPPHRRSDRSASRSSSPSRSRSRSRSPISSRGHAPRKSQSSRSKFIKRERAEESSRGRAKDSNYSSRDLTRSSRKKTRGRSRSTSSQSRSPSVSGSEGNGDHRRLHRLPGATEKIPTKPSFAKRANAPQPHAVRSDDVQAFKPKTGLKMPGVNSNGRSGHDQVGPDTPETPGNSASSLVPEANTSSIPASMTGGGTDPPKRFVKNAKALQKMDVNASLRQFFPGVDEDEDSPSERAPAKPSTGSKGWQPIGRRAGEVSRNESSSVPNAAPSGRVSPRSRRNSVSVQDRDMASISPRPTPDHVMRRSTDSARVPRSSLPSPATLTSIAPARTSDVPSIIRPEVSAAARAPVEAELSLASQPASSRRPVERAHPAKDGELYSIMNQVGEGTFGQVFKATSVQTGLFVALKRIRMEGEKDGFPVTAMREIKLLQSLRHDNVVKLHEMMVSKNGSIYMVFEYMDHDLTGVLSQTHFQFTDAHLKSLCQQMLAGVAYLHHKGVIHRDMKGSNILINNKGVLKLADFGLARWYQKRRHLDYTNRVITLWYRPPELLLGATVYGPEVDMWSVGCIMLELYVKKPVFQGMDEIHQLEVIFTRLGTPTRDSWPGFSQLPWHQLVKPRAPSPNRFLADFTKYLSPAALSLVQSLLELDPARRVSAEAALRTPFFLTEDPAPELPTNLASLDGEWHEFEYKREREKNRKKKKHSETAAKIAAGEAGVADAPSL